MMACLGSLLIDSIDSSINESILILILILILIVLILVSIQKYCEPAWEQPNRAPRLSSLCRYERQASRMQNV